MPTRAEEEDDTLVFRAAQLFLEDPTLPKRRMAAQLTREFSRHSPLSREYVYPLVVEAARRKFIKLVPPLHEDLTRKLAERFPDVPRTEVRVIETAGSRDNAKVSVAAAEWALDLVKELAQNRNLRSVGLGLGPGRATLDFCRRFGGLIASDPQAPKLRLVAISAGCPAAEPEYASISFFNLFPKNLVEKKIGLFAESLVRSQDFHQLKRRPGVWEAFAERDRVDLVVTSMGDINDKHDLLTMFLEQSGEKVPALRKSGWVGNVQYRPYSVKGPILEKPTALRAVTLFELEDLKQMATRRDKRVLLIARQCGICERTHAEALRPLLANPQLKVFSNLVLDAATAVELLGEK